MNTLLQRLHTHISGMAPHQKVREQGQLLVDVVEYVLKLERELAEENSRNSTLIADRSRAYLDKHKLRAEIGRLRGELCKSSAGRDALMACKILIDYWDGGKMGETLDNAIYKARIALAKEEPK